MADQVDDRVTVFGQRKPVQTFNISNFRSQIDALGGIARTSLYRVEISMPNMQLSGKINSQVLTFLVASVSFPGVNLTTQPVQRYGQGPLEDMPTGFVYGTCEMNILADAEGHVLRFFRDWTRGIVEYQSVKGLENKAVPNMKPYHVNYKTQYESQITIVIYDSVGTPVYKMSLLRAFPTAQTSMFLAWSNQDQIMYVPIRFQFFDVAFENSTETYFPGPSSSYSQLSLIEKIYSGGAAIQSIASSLRTPNNLGDVINQLNNTVSGIKQLGNIF